MNLFCLSLKSLYVLGALFVALLGILFYHNFQACSNVKVSKCPKNHFKLPGMTDCHPLLTCNDYSNIHLVMYLTEGFVKKIYLAKWQQHYFIVSNLSNSLFKDDFMHNIRMLESLSPSPFVVQYLGSCNDTLLFTEYQQFGDALNLPTILRKELPDRDNLKTRLQLCLSFVRVLDYLHSSPIGTRVMCDSNSVEKMLSQFLVTQNLELVANDLDALPDANKIGVKCGRRQLFGTFVAPEQLWPYQNQRFDDARMPSYDEKTDIWKVPEVCEWILNIPGSVEGEELSILVNKLDEIHGRCKSLYPRYRPTASDICQFYEKMLEIFE